MSSLVRFSHVAAGDTFTTAELQVLRRALGISINAPGALRYELWKLRAKGLVEKLPHSLAIGSCPNGYRICLLFLKLFHKIYARSPPGFFIPIQETEHDCRSAASTRQTLQSVAAALDELVAAVGLEVCCLIQS